jgi:hypothetical protein
MSTWHQNKALREGRSSLQHETEWTIVDDPPNDLRTLESFTTESVARTMLAKRKEQGRHVYLLPPKRKA